MSQLPIRKLTLYKQGVGYFERHGKFKGSNISLIVPRENINDTLKSLQIDDQEDGKVLGVDYETPSDKETVLSELSVKLNDRSSMIDLLQSLRGSQLELQLTDEQNVAGRLIGVETSLDTSDNTATVLLQDTDSASNIRVYPINKLKGIKLHDERATTDISFFLDVSQTEQTRATVTIRLSEGSHDLNISYLASSPTWRVSYQLVSDGSNQAHLIGWGIFDNKLDEDLENVSLTLISGRPISFEYDLYESYTPSRPQVSDDPMAFQSLSNNPLVTESLATLSHEIRTPLTTIKGYASIMKQGADGPLSDVQKQHLEIIEKSSQRVSELLNDLMEMSRLSEGKHGRIDYSSALRYRSGPLGDLKVSSSYFMPMLIGNAEPEYLTYTVETPVSVKRKQSAMVPIVDYQIEYKEICVFNGDKMSNHPLRVWQLQNSTGKALEQGPVTLVKESNYQGEGLIRFTGVGDEIQIPFALEFGVVVREETKDGSFGTLKVQFDGMKKRAIVSTYQVTEYQYRLTSHIEKEVKVFIERRDPNWGDYFEMPEPAFAAGGHTRWLTTVAPKEETSFIVRTRSIHTREDDVKNWNSSFVNDLKTNKLINTKTFKKFGKYWTETQQEAEAVKQADAIQSEYSQLLTRQNQLRDNLKALGNSERELEIRNRILDDLEASENRRRGLETEAASVNEKIKQLQLSQQRLLDDIYGVEFTV